MTTISTNSTTHPTTIPAISLQVKKLRILVHARKTILGILVHTCTTIQEIYVQD